MSQEQIVADIRTQAEKEAEGIRRQHRDSLDRRKAALQSRVEQIDAEARDRIAEKEKEIEASAVRTTEQEERRIQLALEDRTVRMAMTRVKKRIVERRRTDEYRSILTEWAVEAVTGLDEGSGGGVVLACAPEDLDTITSLVPEIEKRCSVTIKPERRDEMNDVFGVVAIAADGRRAYSNTLEDRLRRADDEIHRLVITRLFDGDKHE